MIHAGNWLKVGRKDNVVKFTIEIGNAEKSRLEYEHNQLMGSLLIKVNDTLIKKARWLLNEPVNEVHIFVVGRFEKSTVRIEKERKPLVGNRNRLYVNDRLTRVFEGI
jgi:hypothetical protein